MTQVNLAEARDEYTRALRLGQREYKELTMSGRSPYPAVLDELLPGDGSDSVQDIPLVEIPARRIVGTKSAGRIFAFTAGFLPLLDGNTEFAAKWISLCADHLASGIRDPIVCYEYLGNFYVQEGNKRVSVLRYFGAAKIPGTVRRILPPQSSDPRIRAYYEFLDFYKAAGLYDVQFCRPGGYAQLLAHLGKEPGECWTDRERRTFTAYYQYFCEAFYALAGKRAAIHPEEALLLWLKVYPFRDLGRLSSAELKKTLAALWEDVRATSQPNPVQVKTAPETDGRGLLGRLISAAPDHLAVAFVHQRDAQSSTWTRGHDLGRQHLEQALPGKLTVQSYFHADTPELAEAILDRAVADGAQVVFTTTPQLSRVTLRAAVKYPKVRFLNCSADIPYTSVRSYYCRVYEGKFITGAIAGALAENDRIGYIASYPILGVPASINAFALGAQMTNPRARIDLRWSCLPGTPAADFVRAGIRVISNRDVPTPDQKYLTFGEYGIFQTARDGSMVSLASPCWMWGRFYENVVRAILSGAWEQNRPEQKAVNYWWGMDSGVIDVKLSDRLPAGVAALAQLLRSGLQSGTLDPFRRVIRAQNGTVMCDGTCSLSPDALLHMDWLCENVEGAIPRYAEVLPISRQLVRELGVFRDEIPAEKEGTL